jgi:hypothetical protein
MSLTMIATCWNAASFGRKSDGKRTAARRQILRQRHRLRAKPQRHRPGARTEHAF